MKRGDGGRCFKFRFSARHVGGGCGCLGLRPGQLIYRERYKTWAKKEESTQPLHTRKERGVGLAALWLCLHSGTTQKARFLRRNGVLAAARRTPFLECSKGKKGGEGACMHPTRFSPCGKITAVQCIYPVPTTAGQCPARALTTFIFCNYWPLACRLLPPLCVLEVLIWHISLAPASLFSEYNAGLRPRNSAPVTFRRQPKLGRGECGGGNCCRRAAGTDGGGNRITATARRRWPPRVN